MKTVSDEIELLEPVMKGLAQHFGDKCEFVLHDYSKGFSSSIVAIENGHLTGRKVGDSGTSVGLNIAHDGKENDVGRFHYTTLTKDGKRLLSSTIYLKDDNDEVIGTLCINMDVSELIGVRNFINQFLDDKPAEAVVYSNVEDLLAEMLKESVNYVGVSVPEMTREQKISGIKFLNKRGAFKIRNSVNVVATFYDVSKYSIYNYINEGDSI